VSAFPNALRAGRAPIELAPKGAGSMTFRIEAAELWDAVRVIARPSTPLAEVKQRALGEFFPNGAAAHEFVLKFRGWEILDENASLDDAGITDGSIVLLGDRRRRAVR